MQSWAANNNQNFKSFHVDKVSHLRIVLLTKNPENNLKIARYTCKTLR